MDPELQQQFEQFDGASIDLRRHVDETRRHFGVGAEGLRGEIRTITEGFSTRSDRLERALREEIVRSHDALAALSRLGYTDLDRRVPVLEGHPPADSA